MATHLDGGADASERTARAKWAQDTHDALTALSMPQRVVIELSYFKAMSQSEIAQRLGLPLRTVQLIALSGLLRLGRDLEAGRG